MDTETMSRLFLEMSQFLPGTKTSRELALEKQNAELREALGYYATDETPEGWVAVAALASQPTPNPDREDRITEDKLTSLLPGSYYMDPPDGGDVTVMEQIQRMAEDAERYRHIRKEESDGDVDICVCRVDWLKYGERYTILTESMADTAVDAARTGEDQS